MTAPRWPASWPYEKCPVCGGTVLTVGSRAWCLLKYENGGCGSTFTRRKRSDSDAARRDGEGGRATAPCRCGQPARIHANGIWQCEICYDLAQGEGCPEEEP